MSIEHLTAKKIELLWLIAPINAFSITKTMSSPHRSNALGRATNLGRFRCFSLYMTNSTKNQAE